MVANRDMHVKTHFHDFSSLRCEKKCNSALKFRGTSGGVRGFSSFKRRSSIRAEALKRVSFRKTESFGRSPDTNRVINYGFPHFLGIQGWGADGVIMTGDFHKWGHKSSRSRGFKILWSSWCVNDFVSLRLHCWRCLFCLVSREDVYF